MTWPVPRINSVLGVQPAVEKVRVVNRSGGTRAKGDVVAFDLHSADAASTGYAIGDTASVFVNVTLPTAADVLHGWIAVCDEAAADNAEMDVVVRGICEAAVESAGGAGGGAALTDVLVAQASADQLDSDGAAAGEKIVAIPLETTAAAAEELCWVIFNGIEGFGTV